jgi:phosphopantetheinyl transferase (holo-ACP synthase)
MVHLAASLIWSGKEAILKALQIGLRADTRAMEIEVPAFSNLSSGNAWSRMVVNRYTEVQGGMNLFWRLTGDYVITLAIMGNRLSQQVPAAAIIQVC